MKLFHNSLRKINTRCNLGEGLLISKDSVLWVDINNNTIYKYYEEKLFEYNLKLKPSVILNKINDVAIVGTDHGIFGFDFNKPINKQLNNNESKPVFKHDIASYRSNDGVIHDSNIYLSFMHRTNPKKNKGFIYKCIDNKYILQDDTLSIPNTFISLTEDTLLISDSQESVIWKFHIDKKGNFVKKSLWAKLPEGISPDGGCLFNDHIFIALWDDASIGVFNIDGTMIKKIKLPVIRPTNCKYDYINSNLWITSAYEGLSESELKKYPTSGSTYIMKVEV